MSSLRRDAELRWALGAGLAALLLYAVQLPPVSGDKDGSEFTLALHALGVPHPTGYPLYTVFGHLFGLVLTAFGASWPTAANAWSALGGALAVALLVAVVRRLTPAAARPAASLSVGVLFGLNPLWTYETTLAEVYAWHLAWCAGAVLLFVVAHERLATVKPLRLALVWGAWCGVGAAHHSTALLVAAPLSVALAVAARRAGRLHPKEVAAVVGAALGVMALGDGFVVWRALHPGAWQWPTLEPSWHSALAHLRGQAFTTYFGTFQPSPEQTDFLSRWMWPTLSLAAVVAAVGALRGGPHAFVLRSLLAAVALNLGFAFAYGVPDPSSYFLAPLALALVVALVFLGELAAARRQPGPAVNLLIALVLAVVAWRWVALGLERRAVFVQFDARLRSMWASVPFDEAFVVMPSDLATRLEEYQQLLGEKPRVAVVSPLSLAAPAVRRRFVARHGFDPIEGLSQEPTAHGLPSPAQVEAWTQQVCARLNAASPLPVVLFVPESDSVRLLRKR